MGSALLLFTAQKLGPLVLLFYCFNRDLAWFYLAAVAVAAGVGAIGGLNEIRFRKLLRFSSISHTGWILLAMGQGGYYYLLYFCLYRVVIRGTIYFMWRHEIGHINQLRGLESVVGIKVLLNLMSLGGLPPLFGFLPKWIVIQSIRMSYSRLVLVWALGLNLVTVYYYLRARLAGFVFTGEVKGRPLEGESRFLENRLTAVRLTGL